MTTIDATVAACAGTLERNLQALKRSSPLAAEAIQRADPSPNVEIVPAGRAGEVSGTCAGVWLASPRHPAAEADRLAETIDPSAVGAVVILGFGVGRHVRAIAQRCKGRCLVAVFEPDAALLRAVFERVDHARWIERSNLLILTDPEDDAAMASGLRGGEAMLAMGVKIVAHPPSRARLGDASTRFCETFTRALAATRTTVVTTLIQSQTTCRNYLRNARSYLAHPGIADLADRCAGAPAVTVAAGPSLARNLELLKTPGLRDRCVIIAAQTVLKQMLELGVRPHFVTSLDFHEISARFYEGLTAADVADTTLVVEPKANAATVRAYPGAIRMPGEHTLDLLLGADLVGAHGPIRAGATVAHLSYYLARHMGCDPVILIGQDLGFTDGLYYADGAAIHRVWAGELNPFRSLETIEWERVARQRRHLRKAPAALGGELYTDEQMATYLAQFNRMFLEDERRGLTTIDATEGGAHKASAAVMPLADALARHAPPTAPMLPDLAPPATAPDDADRRIAQGAERVAHVRRDLVHLAQLSRETMRLLDRMRDQDDNKQLLNRLIRKAHKLRDEAQALEPAFGLVQRINQLGAFKRARTDREIALTDDLSPLEKQRLRIERDRVNVEWIADAADATVGLIDEALAEWERAPAHARSAPRSTKSAARRAPGAVNPARARTLVGAVLVVDPERTIFGAPRDLARPIAGRNPLQWTLARLARSERLGRALVLTPDADAARAIMGQPPAGLDVEFIETGRAPLVDPAISVARAFSRASWRGGLANLTVFDETLRPALALEALDAAGLSAGLILGGDWPLVDPALCDAAIDRWLEAPEANRLTFTQAPPGLAPMVTSTALLTEIAPYAGSVRATIGALLGYNPTHPGSDAIAHRVCAAIDPSVRDSIARFIADDPDCEAVLTRLGDGSLSASAAEIAHVWREHVGHHAPARPDHFIIELAAGRPPHGVAPGWAPDRDAPHRLMPREQADAILRAIADARPDSAVTLAGTGDPLTHPDLPAILRGARESGLRALHVRTPLLAPPESVDALRESADIISVDLYANAAATYERITGADRFREAIENIERIRTARPNGLTLPTPWLAPRITRCEATLDEIEAFYDKWLLILGAACIDPLPAGAHTGRVALLSPPAIARERARRAECFIGIDTSAEAIAG